MDNASNNNTLITSLDRWCEECGIPFSVQEACMHCMPHTVHLAAVKIFKCLFLHIETVFNHHLFSSLKELVQYKRWMARRQLLIVATIKIMSQSLSCVNMIITLQLMTVIYTPPPILVRLSGSSGFQWIPVDSTCTLHTF